MIASEAHASTLLIRLEGGPANALDLELLQSLVDTLDEAEAGDARALVITGSGSAFSAGLDLFRIVEAGTQYLDSLLPALTDAFVRLFRFPRPVVAAVNGHAIAGGCVLACCCDHRLMADGESRIGVPELYVGVPFPTAALEILRFAAGERHARSLVYGGRVHTPSEALRYGLVDEIVPSDELVKRALEHAGRLGGVATDVYATAKRQLQQPTAERIERRTPLDDGDIGRTWKAPATLAGIERYVEQVLGKKRAR